MDPSDYLHVAAAATADVNFSLVIASLSPPTRQTFTWKPHASYDVEIPPVSPAHGMVRTRPMMSIATTFLEIGIGGGN